MNKNASIAPATRKNDPPKRTTIVWDALALVCVAAALGLGGYAVYGMMNPQPMDLPELTERKLPEAGNQTPSVLSEPQLFDVYAPVFSGRDIFKTDEERMMDEAAAASAPQVVNSPSVASWGADYQLMGVIVDKTPKAVVKAGNEPNVQFLSIGDSLGEAVLQKVEENEAVFLYRGQEVRLSFKAPPGQ